MAVELESAPELAEATLLVATHGTSVAESLARSLVSHGFGLRSLEPASGDLEAFFLRLTSGGAPDAS
jgi:hypothetical protein